MRELLSLEQQLSNTETLQLLKAPQFITVDKSVSPAVMVPNRDTDRAVSSRR